MFVDFVDGNWHLQQNLLGRVITARLAHVSIQFQYMETRWNTVKHGEFHFGWGVPLGSPWGFSMVFPLKVRAQIWSPALPTSPLCGEPPMFEKSSTRPCSVRVRTCSRVLSVCCRTQPWPLGMWSSSFPIDFKAQQWFLWHQMDVFENRVTHSKSQVLSPPPFWGICHFCWGICHFWIPDPPARVASQSTSRKRCPGKGLWPWALCHDPGFGHAVGFPWFTHEIYQEMRDFHGFTTQLMVF